MPTLYHYSPLLHLPPILRDGLTLGEIAQPNPFRREQAISLTTQPDPDRIVCWGVSEPIKTAVRYACNLPDGDERLEATRNAWKRLNIPKAFQDKLDPQRQAKWWSFWHGTIPVEWFTVELRGKGGYVMLTDTDRERVLYEVSAVREKFEFVVPPDEPHALDARLKDGSDKSPLWLLVEVYPADRFFTPSAASLRSSCASP